LAKKKREAQAPQPVNDAPQVLRREILDDARRQAQRIVQRAQRDCERTLAEARQAASTEAEAALAEAHAQATRRSAVALAVVPVETGRLRGAFIERALAELRGQVAREWQEAWLKEPNGDKALALAAVALRKMSGDRFILRLTEDDHRKLCDRGDWLPRLRELSGKSALEVELRTDLAPGTAGLIVGDSAGLQIWDNRLVVAIERLWPQLRVLMAEQLGVLE